MIVPLVPGSLRGGKGFIIRYATGTTLALPALAFCGLVPYPGTNTASVAAKPVTRHLKRNRTQTF